MAESTVKPYSVSGSKDLLQTILNDPKYIIQRWNPSKKTYDQVCPYQVYRELIKKILNDVKYPNRDEAANIDNLQVKVFDELVELIPELVQAHLESDMKFKLPTGPLSNGTIYRKAMPAGSKTSDVRNIRENKVDGQVKSTWGEHYIVKCSSKRPPDVVTKERIK